MEMETIKITKADLDKYIPAAKEAKGHVFNMLTAKFETGLEEAAVSLMGDSGTAAATNNPNSRLTELLKEMVTVRVFLDEMRGLDITITSTGFGVVSTNDTAPASKMRVDALDGQLRVQYLRTRGKLLTELFGVEGWGQEEVRYASVSTLFYDFRFLTEFAGKQAPLSKDWEDAAPAILDADRELRGHISDDFMDELVEQMCTNSLSAENRPIVYQVRRYIGAAVQGKRDFMIEYLRRLMNCLEKDIESFPTYAGSEAYERNHFKPYENTQDKGAFHFVG